MPRQPKGTSTTAGDQPSLTEPDRSKEWMVVLAITLVGVVLRVWQPSHMAIEHFDEGVYASNILCPFNGDRYPFRHLYAPPLLPFILEWTLILSGMAASSVMWVNVIAGCVMVPSVWWVSRQWFGPVAGLTSATLAAFSEVHILFSRSALTDVLLCLWMLWGVYWAWRAILTGRPLAIFLAGLFASLAWWTKYNGWLTLAISGSGTLAWLIVPRITPARLAAHFKCAANRDDTPPPGLVLLRWSLFAAIAILGWLPVLIDLQRYGGYAAVSANHAGYFVGFSGWWASLLRQMRNLQQIGELLTCFAMAICVFLHPVITSLRKPQGDSGQHSQWRFFWLIFVLWLIVMGIAFVFMVWGITWGLGLLSVVGLGLVLAYENSKDKSLGAWMLMAWYWGLLIATPLYSPYPRLILPFVTCCWLGTGALFQKTRSRVEPIRSVQKDGQLEWGAGIIWAQVGLVCIALPLLITMSQISIGFVPPLWQDRRGLQRIAGPVLEHFVSNEGQVGVSVLGEPGLFFHLGIMRSHLQSGEDLLLVPAADFGAAMTPLSNGISIYVLTGPHSPLLTDQTTEIQKRLTFIEEWPYRPSDLVRLDQEETARESTWSLDPVPIRLYRVTPASGGR